MMNPNMKVSKAEPGKLLCGVRRAYRGNASIGDTSYCTNPVKTERGYCLRHDPELGPKRDASGQIVKKSQQQVRFALR